MDGSRGIVPGAPGRTSAPGRSTSTGKAASKSSGTVFAAIRPRLAILAFVAIGPLIALLILAGTENRADTLADAARQTEALARIASERQDDVIQEAMHLMTVLARVPEVRTFAPTCHELLRQIGEDHRRISVITAARPDGTVGCVNLAERVTFNLGDRAYMREALATRNHAVVSEIMIGKITRRPTVIMALPILAQSPDDPALGVMVASLDLSAFLSPNRGERPADMQSRVVDVRDGNVLATDAGGRQSGFSQINPGLVAAMTASPGGGLYTGLSSEGQQTIYGFAPLASTHQSLFVLMDRPLASVLAEANQRIFRDLGIGTIAVCLALLGTWLVGYRSLVAPVQRLAEFAGQIGRGRLDASPPRLPHAALELQVLGRAFADMANRLRDRGDELAAMQRTVQISEEHHRLLADNATDMITLVNVEMVRTYVSPACRELLGHEPEELVGQNASNMIHPADRHAMQMLLNAFVTSPALTERAQYRATHKDGRTLWLESSGRRLPNNQGFVVTTRDITDRRAMEERLEAANRLLRVQALQDPLTGIANRRRFDEMLGIEFRRAQRLAEPLSILMIDIDHFKSFNDTYGHPAGDACLRAVASKIQAQMRRSGDTLGRYGGEEFACVLPGAKQAGALKMAEQIRSAIEHMAIANSNSPRGLLTVSIGLVTIDSPDEHEGPAEYVEAADCALYQAKNAGRNTVRVGLAQQA